MKQIHKIKQDDISVYFTKPIKDTVFSFIHLIDRNNVEIMRFLVVDSIVNDIKEKFKYDSSINEEYPFKRTY